MQEHHSLVAEALGHADFPVKSGESAHRSAFRRLTGILPDVAEGRRCRRGLIRNWPDGRKPNGATASPGGICSELMKSRAFKAPSLPVQSRALVQ